MARHVIVGKGPVGTTTAHMLAELGHDVLLVSRSGGKPSGGVEHVQLDATDAAALAAVARGAAALYNCASPPFHRWAAEWPPLAAAVLGAAEASGAVLVTMNNLYGYGPVDGPMTEDLPLTARGTKGKVRAQMWHEALARHEAGRVQATEARASDFFGPRVTANGQLGQRAMPRLLAGRSVRVLGNPDMAHSWSYVPDAARALVRLAGDDRAWGRPWHVPTAAPLSQREMVTRLCAVAGLEAVRVRRIPWTLLAAAGVATPVLREFREVRYQFDRPFVLDSSAYVKTFGGVPTPHEDALTATVRWWRQRMADA